MTEIQSTQIFLPIDRPTRAHCGSRGPAHACNRRPGHAGRHAFYHRHIDGLVRGVWA